MKNHRKYEQYAEDIPLFNGLNPDEVSEILHAGHKLEFRAGDSIFYEGQMGNNIFIVFHGVVDIENNGQVIAKCRTGDTFGEMSMFNHRPHCASANAHTDVKLFTLNEEQIMNLLKQNHIAVRLLLNIIHILSAHLEKTNTMIAHMENS